MVPPASREVPRATRYSGSGYGNGELSILTTGLSPSTAESSNSVRLSNAFVTPHIRPQPRSKLRFGLFPRSLAATEGVALLLSFPPGTEMFHFPGLATYTYVFSVR